MKNPVPRGKVSEARTEPIAYLHVTSDTPALGPLQSSRLFLRRHDDQQYQGIPGITVKPPVTISLKDTVTNRQVPDCFVTDAQTIYNA